MAGNTAYAVPQSQIGLGIEATRGTAASSFLWLPMKAPKYKPDLSVITDETLQGSMVQVYDLVPGLRYDSHGWDGFPYLDTFPALMRCELGSSDTVTAAIAATTLAAAATAGATSLSITGTIATGDWFTVGSGSTLETHYATAVSGAGPYSVTLAYPLRYSQASGATVTGLTGHKMSLLNNSVVGNQPPSATILDYDGEEWRQLTAAQLDKLTLKGDATGLVDYTTTWFANAATTPTSPTPSFSSVQAPPGWSFYMTIGGSRVNYVVDWEIDLARKVKPIPALTGTQEYFLYFADALEATGKLTVVEQSGAPELTKYLAGTQEAIEFFVSDVKTGYAMRLHSSKAQFTTGEVVRGKEFVEATLDFTMLPSPSDALSGGVSPLLADFGNAHTTAY